MSEVIAAQVRPLPQRVSLFALLFGMLAAPLAWVGQFLLGYADSALLCFRGDHPLSSPPSDGVGATLIAYDVAAILVAVAAGAVSVLSWRALAEDKESIAPAVTHSGREHFMAVWGLFSSMWFLAAIVFNAIATVMVPLCLR